MSAATRDGDANHSTIEIELSSDTGSVIEEAEREFFFSFEPNASLQLMAARTPELNETLTDIACDIYRFTSKTTVTFPSIEFFGAEIFAIYEKFIATICDESSGVGAEAFQTLGQKTDPSSLTTPISNLSKHYPNFPLIPQRASSCETILLPYGCEASSFTKLCLSTHPSVADPGTLADSTKSIRIGTQLHILEKLPSVPSLADSAFCGRFLYTDRDTGKQSQLFKYLTCPICGSTFSAEKLISKFLRIPGASSFFAMVKRRHDGQGHCATLGEMLRQLSAPASSATAPVIDLSQINEVALPSAPHVKSTSQRRDPLQMDIITLLLKGKLYQPPVAGAPGAMPTPLPPNSHVSAKLTAEAISLLYPYASAVLSKEFAVHLMWEKQKLLGLLWYDERDELSYRIIINELRCRVMKHLFEEPSETLPTH